MRIITNNPKVRDEYGDKYQLTFVDGGYRDVLVTTRDFVFNGHRLLTHPLMGSLKPNETPYRSVLISDKSGELDTDSVILMGDAMETFDKFARVERPDRGVNTPERMLEDFRLIDHSLISSALESALR